MSCLHSIFWHYLDSVPSFWEIGFVHHLCFSLRHYCTINNCLYLWLFYFYVLHIICHPVIESGIDFLGGWGVFPVCAAVGVGVSAHAMYMGECAPVRLRGMVGVTVATSTSFGKFVGQLLGIRWVVQRLWSLWHLFKLTVMIDSPLLWHHRVVYICITVWKVKSAVMSVLSKCNPLSFFWRVGTWGPEQFDRPLQSTPRDKHPVTVTFTLSSSKWLTCTFLSDCFYSCLPINKLQLSVQDWLATAKLTRRMMHPI